MRLTALLGDRAGSDPFAERPTHGSTVFLVCMLLLGGATRGSAQILTPTDSLGFKDRIERGAREDVECADDDSAEVEAPRLVVSLDGAAGVDRRSHSGSLRRTSGLSQIRLHFTSTRPCGGWDVWVQGLLSAHGETAVKVEPAVLFPLGARIGALSLYGGGSTAGGPESTRELFLEREAWVGATYVTPDLYKAILTRFFSLKPRFAISLLASLQGDVALDSDLRQQRDRRLIPHYSLALPLPLGRPGFFRGLLITGERVVGFRTNRDLRRSSVVAELDPGKLGAKVLLKLSSVGISGEKTAKEIGLHVTFHLWEP